MLPNPKHAVSVILGIHRDQADEAGEQPGAHGEDEVEEAKVAAEDILKAIHDEDPGELASALKSFFLLVDAEPHEEGPHDGEDGEDQ